MAEPVTIEEMLIYVSLYLDEELIVRVTGERPALWSVRPAGLVRRFVPTPGDHGRYQAVFLEDADYTFDVMGSQPHEVLLNITPKFDLCNTMRIPLSERDALLLGLALVQAAGGSYHPNDLQQAFEEHKFLVNQSQEKNDVSEEDERNPGRDPSGR